MLEAELNLTEQERTALQEISRRTGKSEGQLIREAVDQLIARFQSNARPALMQKARGIWKDLHRSRASEFGMVSLSTVRAAR